MQEIIFVAIGRYVVTIDISKAEQFAGTGGFNAEHPFVCRLGSPLKGVSVAAQHDDVVTDLDVPLSGPFRLASASKDGTVNKQLFSFDVQIPCLFSGLPAIYENLLISKL